MCICDGMYQQLKWGYGLEGSYPQLPAPGDTGMQELATGQTECLSTVAGGIYLVHAYIHVSVCISIYVDICIYILSLVDFHPAQPDRGEG